MLESKAIDHACLDRPTMKYCRTRVPLIQPVCGCNGQTYRNPCWARRDGVTDFDEGPCVPDDQVCPKDDEIAVHCPGEPRNCTARPAENCNELEDNPVCGCNGRVYDNTCEMILNHRTQANDLECGQCDGTCGENFCTGDEQVCPVCGSPNTCEEKPDMGTCTSSTPFCGCDENMYRNECEAKRHGVFDSLPSEFCNPDECSAEECSNTGQFNLYPRVCTECGESSGVCVVRPWVCPPAGSGDAVCGCDGNSYPSACHARQAGHPATGNDDCFGECGDCESDEYCTDCDPSEGQCAETPDTCGNQYQLVCGCDGWLYWNPCEAHQAGVAIADSLASCL